MVERNVAAARAAPHLARERVDDLVEGDVKAAHHAPFDELRVAFETVERDGAARIVGEVPRGPPLFGRDFLGRRGAIVGGCLGARAFTDEQAFLVGGALFAQRGPSVLRGAVGEVQPVLVGQRFVDRWRPRRVFQLFALGIGRHVTRAHPASARDELEPPVGAVPGFHRRRLGERLLPFAQNAEPYDLFAVDEHVALELGPIENERLVTRGDDGDARLARVDGLDQRHRGGIERRSRSGGAIGCRGLASRT